MPVPSHCYHHFVVSWKIQTSRRIINLSIFINVGFLKIHFASSGGRVSERGTCAKLNENWSHKLKVWTKLGNYDALRDDTLPSGQMDSSDKRRVKEVEEENRRRWGTSSEQRVCSCWSWPCLPLSKSFRLFFRSCVSNKFVCQKQFKSNIVPTLPA